MANFRNYFRGHLQPFLPSEDATLGAITESHVGNIVVLGATPTAQLAVGTSNDDARYIGIIAAVPNSVTAGGSVPFYVMPFTPEEEIEVEYSTDYSATVPTDADIGSYIAFGSTATVAGAKLDTSTISGTVGGSTVGRWLKITGYDTNRKMIYGRPDATRISR